MMIEKGKMVRVAYDLYVDAEETGKQELMERATEEHPLAFCFGVEPMLPMFEANLVGLKEGDAFDFTIPCQEAYGEYDEESVIMLDKKIFEVDGKFDSERIVAGSIVPLMDTEGNHFQAQVVDVTDTQVQVDLNHPLAGENLHFVGKVVGVREATEEELDALKHQQHGCGCGCGDCGGEDACGCNCSGCDCH
ncbi:MAG: FKBP-type peptidyl-prolyl cis-trans isomerase [Paludibacteraceae bacterium]|nr:FKBP-type peptidyl-prolyl cis-trans isomerase [Paludibacteraceae bacterium]MBO7259522.1 FKBP-type peptidyl-prolyl cis-trans isomerase [Paludibacteraceae bacterium]